MPLQLSNLTRAFQERFGRSPQWIVRAPGRVNLIGEHTDYNDGFVLPLAIDRAIWIALDARADRRVAVFSADFQQSGEFSLDQLVHEQAGWLEYLKGTAWSLQDAGYSLAGWEGVVQGDVPQGAGLSSSAALEVATARAFAAVSDWEWEPVAMARLGQRAENRWVGVNCALAAQNMMLAAHSLGIGSCFIGRGDVIKRRGPVFKKLGIEKNYYVQASLVFGYPKEFPKNIPERRQDKVISWK